MLAPHSSPAESWPLRTLFHRRGSRMPRNPRGPSVRTSPPSPRRGPAVLGMVVVVLSVLVGITMYMAADPRPLGAQFRAAADAATALVKSRGLQVSLRAVADGQDAAPKPPERLSMFAQAEAEPPPPLENRVEPARADPAPRQLQPTR
jgi:hypothetical protein